MEEELGGTLVDGEVAHFVEDEHIGSGEGLEAGGQAVSWAWDTANVHDQVFLPLVEALEDHSIVLADTGFNDADGIPANLKLCPRGTWNERMLVETALSLVTTVCHLKKVFHRTRHHFQARLAYVAAMFNILLGLNRHLQPDAPRQDRLLHLAPFAL